MLSRMNGWALLVSCFWLVYYNISLTSKSPLNVREQVQRKDGFSHELPIAKHLPVGHRWWLQISLGLLVCGLRSLLQTLQPGICSSKILGAKSSTPSLGLHIKLNCIRVYDLFDWQSDNLTQKSLDSECHKSGMILVGLVQWLLFSVHPTKLTLP